jgi:Leucine-rich repeat (LRR) protein
LPDEAYQKIDEILSLRQDITFRLFGFYDEDKVDISFLLKMPHLKNLCIDRIDFRNDQQKINFDVLARLRLKQFYIDCFDLRNYEFIKYLSDDLEDLLITADTMGPGIVFDCAWLLKYVNLKSLWLGKKAKKNIELLSQLPKLKDLTLRGIKIADFSFLHKMNLEKLALFWNSNNDLHELGKLKNLREIELWRINKLDDISFIEDMTNLEIIRLEDLKHVTSLPDLSKLTKLKKIVLNGTGIDMKSLPDNIKPYCASF